LTGEEIAIALRPLRLDAHVSTLHPHLRVSRASFQRKASADDNHRRETNVDRPSARAVRLNVERGVARHTRTARLERECDCRGVVAEDAKRGPRSNLDARAIIEEHALRARVRSGSAEDPTVGRESNRS